MEEETGCDGFMIARGAEGNPWIFHQILHYFETGEIEAKPSFQEVTDMILRHAAMQIEFKGEYTGIQGMQQAWRHGIPPGTRIPQGSAQKSAKWKIMSS